MFKEKYFLYVGGIASSFKSMAPISQVSSNKCFKGLQKIFSHDSLELKCSMRFSIYLPHSTDTEKFPILYYLSGLTCTEENFTFKSGFQKYAAKHGIIVVAPDTSPRGCDIEGENDNYDLGTGAGFYLDAVEEKWKSHYRMYSYVTKELPAIINANFPVIPNKVSIFGHSMGGHGALICALKNPGTYCSVSAFAPICNPMEGEWGKKAFSNYLGDNKDLWKDYDACCLVKNYQGPQLDVLIDQGKDDNFLNQLFPDRLAALTDSNSKISITLRTQEGYDHSYYFISTFIGDHFKYHAKHLKS